jgi:hypothetical protein
MVYISVRLILAKASGERTRRVSVRLYDVVCSLASAERVMVFGRL